MTFPIFFSVASQDIALAERIYENYPEGLFYLYTKNGKQNAWHWDEIEKEQLPFAKSFAIFWSRHYLRNEGTARELILAADFFREKRISDCIIIRCDNTPLFASEFSEALSEHETKALDALRSFLKFKRSDPLRQLYPEALRLVDEAVSRLSSNDIPFQDRPVEMEALKAAAQAGKLSYRPALWISGFNGYGRKTLSRELFRRLNPNLIAVEVDIDETTLPEQIILRLESEFRGSEQAALVEEARKAKGAGPQAVVETINSLASENRYALLRQSRLYEESVRLPEWLEAVIQGLEPGRFPKLVIAAQLPLSEEATEQLGDKVGALPLPSMSRDVATEFAWSVLNVLGGQDEDWNDASVAKVVRASGGTPELIITILRHATRLADPAQLDTIVGKESQRFTDTLNHLVTWAFNQLEGCDAEKRALLFLDNVSPVAREDVEAFLETPASATTVLARLMKLGLVERSLDGLYRISPLLSNRLNVHLTDPDLLAGHKSAMNAYARKKLDIPDGEHGYVRIEAKIKTELLTGQKQLSENVRDFVGAAHYLQIGIRLYNANRYRDAAHLLELAFENRNSFELTAQIEACRFYGLSLIRSEKTDELEQVLSALRGRWQGVAIANYLEGEQRRVEHNYAEALPFYHLAQEDAKKNKDKEREEKIIRPYVDCILHTKKPNIVLAKTLVDRAVSAKRTVYALWIRARVYLHAWKQADGDETSKEALEYFDVLDQLESDPGGESFFAQVRSEEEELRGDWADAIGWMEEAAELSKRFDDRLKVWGVRIRSGEKKFIEPLIKEIEDFCADPMNRSQFQYFGPRIARRYAQALKATGELQQFRIGNLGLPLNPGRVRNVYLTTRKEWEVRDV